MDFRLPKRFGDLSFFLGVGFFLIFVIEAILLFRTFSLSKFIFFVFSINLVFSVWMVIFSFNPVYSILFLVLAFFNGAGLLFFLGLDFLAFMLLIVYIGAISVLFLFVVMMLNIRSFRFFFSSYHYLICGAMVLVLFFLVFFELFFNFTNLNIFVSASFFTWTNLFFRVPNIELFGYLIYGPYFFHLFLSLLILLVAVVGSISLVSTRNFRVRRQDEYTQILRYSGQAQEQVLKYTNVSERRDA